MLVRIIILLTLSTLSLKAHSFSFGSYNIRNFLSKSFKTKDPFLRSLSKTDEGELVKILKEAQLDLIAVQEIIDVKGLKELVRTKLPNHKAILTECGGRGRQKLGFIYNTKKLELLGFSEDDSINGFEGCDQGLRPAAIAHFYSNKKKIKFTAISVHLKAGGKQRHADQREKQYRSISLMLRRLSSSNIQKVIVMGDFNTTDYVLRNQNYHSFIGFLNQSNLKNLTESVKCTSYWPGKNTRDELFSPSQLDHILISRELHKELRKIKSRSGTHCIKSKCTEIQRDLLGLTYKNVSDHCPIMIESI